MYLNFFGLRKEPFHITPDPEFLFLSSSHKEALASIVYGIEKRKGFIAVVGGVGVGKTTLLRSYLEGRDRKHLKIVYLFNSNISFKDLLEMIFEELDIEVGSDDVFKLLSKLQLALIEEYKQGFNVVLVVDEAQNMPVETLENLRMLSNLETTKEKLIQIVLIGQPEFDVLMNRNEMRQLKQRLAVRSTINPLSKKDSVAYVRHRLQLARIQPGDSDIFTSRALKEIVKSAGGIPRIINILCDNALITGYGYHKKPVTSKIARETITDFQGKSKHPFLRWATVAAAALIILVAGLFMFSLHGNLIDAYEHKSNTLLPLNASSVMEKENNAIKKDAQSDQRKIVRSFSQGLLKSHQVHFKKAEGPESEIRIVKDGDTFAGLTNDVYGWSDEALISWLHKHNNHITDVDVIHSGMKIVFPKLDEGWGRKSIGN
jgi:general secretion pathway protein A